MNKYINMIQDKQIIAINKTNECFIRILTVTKYERIFDGYIDFEKLKSFECKLQIKINIFGIFPKWITIKTFIAETLTDDDVEFCRNEAIECYNNIINPYKYI